MPTDKTIDLEAENFEYKFDVDQINFVRSDEEGMIKELAQMLMDNFQTVRVRFNFQDDEQNETADIEIIGYDL